MSIAAFTPSIWSARFERILDQNTVYAQRTNSNFEGEVRSYGDVVKIPFFATKSVTQHDYNEDASGTRTQVPEEVTGATLDLNIDVQKDWAVSVEDIEELQTKPNLMDQAMTRAGISQAQGIDDYLKSVYAGAAADIAADAARGTAASTEASRLVTIPLATTVEAADGAFGKAVIAALVATKRKMTEANLPLDGRWAMVNAAFVEGIERFVMENPSSGVYTPVTTESTLRNGFSGNLLGFDLFVTSNPQSVTIGSTANSGWRVYLGQGNEAVTMARQITTVERYRSHTAFADVVRGLVVYGAKLVHPDRIWLLEHKKAA